MWTGTVVFDEAGFWSAGNTPSFNGDDEYNSQAYYDQFSGSNNYYISFDVEQGFVDTTPPVVNVPSNQEFSTTDSSKYYTFSASATDIISGNIVPYCTSSVGGPGGSLAFATSGTYGGSFVVGNHLITCVATDDAGNAKETSFTVTVNQVALDFTPPVFDLWLAVNNGMTLTATDSSGALLADNSWEQDSILNGITASDNVAIDTSSGNIGNTGVTCNNQLMWDNTDPGVNQQKFPIGTTTITCTVSDTSGNTASHSFTVTVTPPQYTIEFNQNSAYNSACQGTNSCVNPSQLDIPVNSEVRFMNNDNAAHMTVSGNPVAGASGHWTSSLITSGQFFEHTFTQSGTYEYYDSFFPHIKGQIVVGGDST